MIDYSLVYPIDETNYKVLLGRHKKGKWEGYWNGFGGKRISGESFEECAIRELREETGLHIDPKRLIRRANLIFEHKQRKWEAAIVWVYTVPWKWYIATEEGFSKSNVPEDNEHCSFRDFSIANIPWSKMPEADIHWLNRVLYTKDIFSARLTWSNYPENIDYLQHVYFDSPK